MKREVEKIYEQREDYEKAIGHVNKAFSHHDRAYRFFKNRRFDSSIEEVGFLENETEELGGFLERKVRERLKPIVDTYNLLSKR